jgi:hypothetical protein
MMEPFWSPVVATAGNQPQIGFAADPQKPAKTAAIGCNRLPLGAHGKEGVDGSSPSEGSAKPLHGASFPFRSTCESTSVRRVWSHLWSSRVENAAEVARHRPHIRLKKTPAPELSSVRRGRRFNPIRGRQTGSLTLLLRCMLESHAKIRLE